MEGESLVEVWRGGKVLVAVGRAPLREGAPLSRRARPFGGERAPVAYLIDRGLKPIQEVW